MTSNNLTIDFLKSIVYYDKQSGLFFKKNKNNEFKKTGSISKNGYVVIRIDKKTFYGHRLAWFYLNQCFPIGDIDHIDGNKSNNSIENLREVNRSVNMQNMKKAKINNKCGLLGVGKKGDKFRARIKINGKQISIGIFDTAQEAHLAYLNEKRKHHIGCTI